MLYYLVQQMQDEFKKGIICELSYLFVFQVKQRKDYTFKSQSIDFASIFTKLLWSNKKLKDVA